MAAIGSLFIIIVISVLVTRIASVALTLTGISEELANFQARSAFTGVGFTTSESENVVNHPVRRRILMSLMVLGNVGFVSALASLLISLIDVGSSGESLVRIAVLSGGACLLWFMSTRKVVDDAISRVIKWALRKWTGLEVFDYLNILGLSENFGIRQFEVQEDDWLAGKTISNSCLRDEGVLVLLIDKVDGERVSVPRLETKIQPGDQLVLYGEESNLHELRSREQSAAGDRSHGEAVEKQKERERQQKVSDEVREKEREE